MVLETIHKHTHAYTHLNTYGVLTVLSCHIHFQHVTHTHTHTRSLNAALCAEDLQQTAEHIHILHMKKLEHCFVRTFPLLPVFSPKYIITEKRSRGVLLHITIFFWSPRSNSTCRPWLLCEISPCMSNSVLVGFAFFPPPECVNVSAGAAEWLWLGLAVFMCALGSVRLWVCACVHSLHNVYNGLTLQNGSYVTLEQFDWALSPAGQDISGSHHLHCSKFIAKWMLAYLIWGNIYAGPLYSDSKTHTELTDICTHSEILRQEQNIFLKKLFKNTL